MGIENLTARVIIALDVNSLEQARDLVINFRPYFQIFKVGPQLFIPYGIRAIEVVKEQGGDVFLDLKFYDIPETVAKACEAATSHQVSLITLHALGGKEMIKRAVEQTRSAAERLNFKRPLLLGVTVLTSLNQTELKEMGINLPLKEAVTLLAWLSKLAGTDGVIASAQEIGGVKERCGKDFLVITPGIRPAFVPAHDQKRITTPKEAFQRGADYIIIGRPLIQANDPMEAAKRLIAELKEL